MQMMQSSCHIFNQKVDLSFLRFQKWTLIQVTLLAANAFKELKHHALIVHLRCCSLQLFPAHLSFTHSLNWYAAFHAHTH